MTQRSAVDPTTGFTTLVPEGWAQWPDAPIAVLLVDAEARARGDAFVSSLAITVSPRQPHLDLDAIVLDATRSWLDAVDYSHVLNVHEWAAPQPDTEGRLSYATYSNGMMSITLLSAFLLHDAIVSRLDLTAPVGDSRGASEMLFTLLDSVILPTTPAESNLSGADVVAFQASLIERSMPQ